MLLRKHSIAYLLLLIFFFLFCKKTEADERRLSYNGYIRNETAYRYVDLQGLTKSRDVLRVEMRYDITRQVGIVGTARYSYDHVYDIADPNKVNPRQDLRELQIPRIQDPDAIAPAGKELIFGVPEEAKNEAELKELYLDTSFENIDLRIGKQLVFWGIFPGFRITDEINPSDFREFILKDIVDLRIPLWMGRIDYYYGNSNIELLLIPDLKFHQPALNGSEFEFFRELPNDKVPNIKLVNTEWGVKVAGNQRGIEWSVSALSVYDDFPTAFRLLRTDLLCAKQVTVPTVILSPRHPRLTNVGGSLRGNLNRLVLRMEGAYIRGKYYGIDPGVKNCKDIISAAPKLLEFNKTFGELKRDVAKGSIGVDFSFMGTDVSVQLWQQYILDYDERIMEKGHQLSASFFLRKPFDDDKYITELLTIYFIDPPQLLYRPKILYLYSDRIRFTLGMDILSGSAGERPGKLNFIGQFDNRDRIYMEMQMALFG